jgi:hypothetical protein
MFNQEEAMSDSILTVSFLCSIPGGSRYQLEPTENSGLVGKQISFPADQKFRGIAQEILGHQFLGLFRRSHSCLLFDVEGVTSPNLLAELARKIGEQTRRSLFLLPPEQE